MLLSLCLPFLNGLSQSKVFLSLLVSVVKYSNKSYLREKELIFTQFQDIIHNDWEVKAS